MFNKHRMKQPSFFQPPTLSTIPSELAIMEHHHSTYHSFNDIELFEPIVHSRKNSLQPKHSYSSLERPKTGAMMQRQDSGYESYSSYTPSPRTSTSHSRMSAPRKASNASNTGTGSIAVRNRTRPSTKRSNSHNPWTSSAIHVVPPPPQPHHELREATSYFQFPSPDPEELPGPMVLAEPLPPSPPPQTTHYWTSDSTRRLEYATIDASCRGIKGWVKRHLVPGCFTGGEDRHIAFDDDTGSVRRYRLELDPEEKTVPYSAPSRRRAWQIWGTGSERRS